MKRVTLLALLVVGALALVATPAIAEPDGTVQPTCADIVGGSAFWHQTTPPENTVTGSVETLSPSCKGVVYTLYVTYTSGGTTSTVSQSLRGDNTTTFVTGFQVAVPAGATDVCVYYTSSKGNKVLDRAPDDGCVALTPDTAPAQGFH